MLTMKALPLLSSPVTATIAGGMRCTRRKVEKRTPEACWVKVKTRRIFPLVEMWSSGTEGHSESSSGWAWGGGEEDMAV
jgi:hypothetical protein